jgi:hypothetical protein
MIGGLEQANEDWQYMVLTSINYQGVSIEVFNLQVQECLDRMDVLEEESAT